MKLNSSKMSYQMHLSVFNGANYIIKNELLFITNCSSSFLNLCQSIIKSPDG